MERVARFTVLALALLLAAPASAQAEGESSPRQLLEQLHRVRLDPTQSYKVTELRLRRDAIRILLRHGTLVFFEPVAGQVTGAVFEGVGEILLVPPDLPERQQMLKFTGSPILTESFRAAYFRFQGETAAELREQLRAGRGQPFYAPELLERWAGRVPLLNRAQATRLLLDFLSVPRAYFYAALFGEHLGRFDVVVDERRAEPVLVGQLREVEGVAYYDVWTSFAPRAASPAPEATRALAYRIDATFTPSYELDVACEVDLELAGGDEPDAGRRVALFELARAFEVSAVEELTGAPQAPRWRGLGFFQHIAFDEEAAETLLSDVVIVVLPPAEDASRRRLRFHYRGRVISDVGGGVLFVGARSSWYPRAESHLPAHYELRFRYPRALELVAVGQLRESREAGEQKESLWVTEVPLVVAGFNVGDYVNHKVSASSVPVSVYANRRLEPFLIAALRTSPETLHRPRRKADRWRPETPVEDLPPTLTAPAAQAEAVGRQVAEALDYFSQLFGAFPYGELKVTQIPGRFGQGYPGLLYLSTLSFLAEGDLARLGLGERVRQHFARLMPAHETAHQWWGNWVAVPRYRDQWLAESLAAYSSLLFLEQQPGGAAEAAAWRARFRDDLLKRDRDAAPLDAAGPLALGQRLDSSRSPNGYATLVYSKGPWVIHMLRELFRDPRTGSDAAFFEALRRLAQASDEPLTTERFRAGLEAALPEHADVEQTGELDWFFEQWVGATGIPRYRLRWQARRQAESGWEVEGTIEQSGVPPAFTMPVPLYARQGAELVPLGRVIVTGEAVKFRFRVAARPSELVLDPHQTVLRAPE